MLHSVRQVTPATEASANRDKYVEYFNGPGKVPFQNKMMGNRVLRLYLGCAVAHISLFHLKLKTKTPWPLIRKRSIQTERPPLVGEVSANFCGYRVSRGQRNGSSRSLIRFS
jgi:hypothetical protein